MNDIAIDMLFCLVLFVLLIMAVYGWRQIGKIE